MRLVLLALALSACGAATAPVVTSEAHAEVGAAAPTFALTGVDGKTYDLAKQRGKTVVLEWYNPDCPFVKHAHGEGGALRTLGNDWTAKNVVWWAINSGAEGKQGHGQVRNEASLAEYGVTYPVLLDPTGATGTAYGAKTTPHMFVINPEGQIVYQGAIDNAPLGDSGGKAVVNYVDKALTEHLAGKAVVTASTKPYGCSVKY